MSLRILPAFLALLCLAPAAFAATYRCDVGGSVMLTDKPCAAAADPMPTPAAYRPATEPAPARQRRQAEDTQRGDAARARQDAERLREKCSAVRESLGNRRAESEAERVSKRAAEEAYKAHCLGQ